MIRKKLEAVLPTIYVFCLAILLTSVAVLVVGENPIHVLKILGNSGFGSAQNFSYTLFYATPMLLTGTAVWVALKAGLFNIGAEGQLYIGALCAILWGTQAVKVFPSVYFVILGGMIASFLGGALWGGIAGYLRTKRQTHEVIATIMLNFIAAALVNWAILNPLKNPDNQAAETYWLTESLRIPHLWLQTTPTLLFALFVVHFIFWIIKRTWWGFRVRATGQNPIASRLAGIKVEKTAFLSMALSGGIAGLVGFHEVFCNSYRLIDSFSPGYGFTGLIIALLCRDSLHGLIVIALLFGALHKGALDLDLETEKITRELSAVIQALILISLAVVKRKK